MNDSDYRTEVAKGLLAGGLLLVGLATGSGPFFTLLIQTSTGVGGNLLSGVIDRTITNWRSGWTSSKGVLSDPIRHALSQAFVNAIRELESEWKTHPQYHYLVYSGQRARAQASLDTLRELREDANVLFQTHEELANALQQEKIFSPASANEHAEIAGRELFDRMVDRYLGLVEHLAELAKKELPERWVLEFGNIVKSERGTPAWRACQQLWQASLATSLHQLQQASNETDERVTEIKEDVSRIASWLDKWHEQLDTLPETHRDSNGDTVFNEQVLKPQMDALQSSIAAVKANTEAIIALLTEKFDTLDFEEGMKNFLQKELLHDQYVNLKQAGYETETGSTSLAKVFVDLPASDGYALSHREMETSLHETDDLEASSINLLDSDVLDHSRPLAPGVIADIVTAAEQPLDPESLSMRSGQEHEEPWSELSTRRPGRFVLIGGPGQGKTTVSQFICQLYRAALLKHSPNGIRDLGARQALREIEESCTEESIAFPSVLRIPFRIVLNDFAAKLASEEWAHISSLLSYIVDHIHRRTEREISSDHLRRWLAGYPWVIILDGLDEVPASSNREEVLEAIDNFWVDVGDSNADVLVVGTTRPQGYSGDFAPNLYTHKTLTPLPKASALHYAKRLLRLRYRQEQDRQELLMERLRSALADESTARLMRSPLQVTIMASLVERFGKPPRERWSLFQRYYDVIYSRETERDIPAATILRDHSADINVIHHRVGLLLQIESEHSGQTGARLARERFATLVKARLEEEEYEGEELDDLKERIIEAAKDRLVFLAEVEAGQIGFEIRSLQEFMAAEALMQGEDKWVRQRLLEIAPVINWRNVFLFAAGKCYAKEDRQHLREAIRGICVDLNESEDSDDDITQITLAGSKLALDLLEDGPAQRPPRYARGLARLALRLLQLPPSSFHARLAALYNSRLESVFKEEIRACFQAGSDRHLGAWAVLISMASSDVAWANELFERLRPSSRRDQLKIAQSAVAVGEGAWLYSKLGKEGITHIANPDDFMPGSPSRLLDYDLVRQLERMPQLSWLHNLYYRRAPETSIALQLPHGGSVTEALVLRPLNKSGYSYLSQFENLLDTTPGWVPLIAAAQLLDAPSSDTLAAGLRKIADYARHQSFSRWSENIMHFLPWPLGSLLATANDDDDLLRIADKVVAGHLGDLNDWLQAEWRWQTHGVTNEDLDYMTDDHWPFDANIAQVGFPVLDFDLRSISGGFCAAPKTLGMLQAMIEMFSARGESRLRSTIAHWILFSLAVYAVNVVDEGTRVASREYPRDVDYPSIITFEQVRDILTQVPQDSIVYLNILNVIDWEGLAYGERAQFLNQLGQLRGSVNRRVAYVSRHDGKAVESL